MIFVMLALAIYFGFIASISDLDTTLIIMLVIVFFLIYSFTSLTVTIDEKNVKIKFGYGIYKKKFPLKEISSVKAVKNHWYYGWGIRYWFWPRMWIFNVSGFDAVEIKMKNNNIYRIGTDDVKNLEYSIKREIKKI